MLEVLITDQLKNIPNIKFTNDLSNIKTVKVKNEKDVIDFIESNDIEVYSLHKMCDENEWFKFRYKGK